MRDAIKTTFQRLWETERVGQLRALAIGIWDKLKGVGADAWKRIKAWVSKPLGWVGDRWKDLIGLFALDSQSALVVLVLGTIALLIIVGGFFTRCLGNQCVTCSLVTFRDDFYANLGTELLSLVIAVLFIDQLARKRQTRQEKSDAVFQLGSDKLDVADEAVRKLRGRGWLYDGTLTGAYLSGACLEGADLVRANLEGANLVRANLEGANLIHANLEGARLMITNLKGAKLMSANLKGAYLMEANLAGADLSSAHLQGAILSGADLEGADLSGAHLAGAHLTGAYLAGAKWPDDFTPPPSAKRD